MLQSLYATIPSFMGMNTLLESAIKSDHTRALYKRNLEYFTTWAKLTEDEIIGMEQKKLEALVMAYIGSCKKMLAPNTVRTRYSPIKLLLQMNDVILNWVKIEKTLPSVEYVRADRLPTSEELQQLEKHLKFLGRTLLHLLLESGIRIEAASLLTAKDLTPIPDLGICKIGVYPKTRGQYTTFCSMQTYQDMMLLAKKRGSIFPKLGGLRAIMLRAWKRAEIKTEWSSNHVFRKIFKSRGEQSSIKSIYVEHLLGHKQGLNQNYLRISDTELAKIYVQLLPYLSLTLDPAGSQKLLEEMRQEIEALRTYKANTDTKVREEASKIAEDLVRDRIPQIIDQRMEAFLKKKNA